MTTYNELLKIGNDIIEQYEKEESAVKILLLHLSNLESYELVAKLNDDAKCEKEFIEKITMYAKDNIPIQHIIGYDYFYSHKFIVNKDVLIPRFETEELVSNILMYYDEVFGGKNVNVVDIGTGSGCIGLTLKKEENNMKIICTDISEDALSIAKKNASNLGVDIEFRAGDMLEPIKGLKFDILISNPPYIPSEEHVDSLVVDNEPNIALFGGVDGLKFYRIILENAKELLNEKFIIAFEHAYNTADELRKIAKLYFEECEIFTLKDMQNKDRMTFVIKR